MIRKTIVAATVMFVATIAVPANAATNLVRNGDFEILSAGTTNQWYANGARLADWVLAPSTGNAGTQAVVFGPGAADHQGAEFSPGVYFGLYGPGNGSANGLPAASPTGGNFFGADDPVNYHQTLSQTIYGLTIGQEYRVSFQWAAAQVTTFNGAT